MHSNIMSSVDIFGVALTAKLPEPRVDVSDLREIPDNQEVFAHTCTDQSIIIEVMEYEESEDDQALRIYFKDLVDTNNADVDVNSLCNQPLELSSLSASCCKSCRLMKGIQSVSKFKDTARNTVEVHMALLRLPQFTSDILLTFNNPLHINAESNSSDVNTSTSESAWTEDHFLQTVKSLTIVNNGLFG
ncbi:ran guanine nucleotide release factor-like [Watersipora subatra]|uniref:ran guanine nucleotide release factor-like n=1 Tax=Watersipora subatra TaxID=2589382 RepID=UPI00355BBEE5